MRGTGYILDSDLVLHAPVLIREPAWPAFANQVQPLFIRVVQSFWTHSNSLLKVIQSEFNRNQSQSEQTAPTTNTADPERYSLLKWLSHEKLVATNRAIIHRLRGDSGWVYLFVSYCFWNFKKWRSNVIDYSAHGNRLGYSSIWNNWNIISKGFQLLKNMSVTTNFLELQGVSGFSI